MMEQFHGLSESKMEIPVELYKKILQFKEPLPPSRKVGTIFTISQLVLYATFILFDSFPAKFLNHATKKNIQSS